MPVNFNDRFEFFVQDLQVDRDGTGEALAENFDNAVYRLQVRYPQSYPKFWFFHRCFHVFSL